MTFPEHVKMLQVDERTLVVLIDQSVVCSVLTPPSTSVVGTPVSS